jgi:large subunit ribosomal protein L6
MSRIGKQPIALPQGVEVKVANNEVSVKGSKGTLTQQLVEGIKISIEDGHAIVSVDENIDDAGALHGLYRALISNMVLGVTAGFEKKLEMIGVGYRAIVQGKFLDVQVGFSHPTKVAIPEGVTVRVDKNTAIFVSGADKQVVGQFAATVRATRPPEPYQGKGIRYSGEYVRKKAGKSAAKK